MIYKERKALWADLDLDNWEYLCWMMSSTSMFSAQIIILEMTRHTANIYLRVQLVAKEVKYKQSSVTDDAFLSLLSHQPPVFKPRSRGVTGQRVQQRAGLLGDSRLKERSLWYMMLILSPSSRQVVRNKEASCEQGDWWRLGEMRRWWEVGGQRQTWFPSSPLINTMWCPLTVNYVVKKNKWVLFFF